MRQSGIATKLHKTMATVDLLQQKM